MSETADDRLAQWLGSTGTWNDYPTRLLQCYADWLRNASPDDWHRAAEAWNWTYESGPMHWIVRQADCDLATAVLIYYLSGPDYYLSFSPDDVPPSAQDGFELVSTIRGRVAAGGYTRSEIAYDPRHEFVNVIKLAPISDDPSFPVVLTGRKVERPFDWSDGFPHEVWEAARSTSS